MSRLPSQEITPIWNALDKKTARELRRLLKRDKITFEEYVRRSVVAYDWIYPGPDYKPAAPAE